MKKLIAICLMMVSGAVFAQTNSTNTATTQSTAAGGQVVFAPNSTVTDKYNAASAIAPQLVAGLDTCMGSSSIGGQGMSFGVSVGTTWKDEDCRRIKDARELWNMGNHAAAMALLCTDDDTRYAIAVSGGVQVQRADGATIHVACPMSKKEWEAAGRPMLDPATGQPYTQAQMNPVAPTPVAAAPTPTQAVNAYEKLSPEVKAAIENQIKADQIESKAAMLAKQ
jgi:hypothetical protein